MKKKRVAKKKRTERKGLEKGSNKKKSNTKRVVKYLVIGLIVIWLVVSLYSKFKPLPEGISVEGEVYSINEEDIDFYYDLTYDFNGQEHVEQEIFDEIFKVIQEAKEFIVIDMFLFNTDYSENVRYRNITTEMKDLLIKKKQENPGMKILFITDPINNFYGSYESQEITELKNAGVNVVITDLNKLRDVNLFYAGLYRSYFQWWGQKGKGWLPHPLGRSDIKVTLGAWLKLLNTKANHRKVIVADSGERVVSIVTSANPHEASSKHSNVAIKVYDSIAKDIVNTELSVAKFSGTDFDLNQRFNSDLEEVSGNVKIQLLTEQKIRDSLLEEIGNLEEGDKLEMIMFYLSDRRIVKALLEASERGVDISLLLDPNKDAFAREKNGIPNRQTAYELVKKSEGMIRVKWSNTHGEQQHSKITIIIKKDGTVIIFLGSANLTKRNIGNYNLEMDAKIICLENSKISLEVRELFDKLWNNKKGNFSLEFENYKDSSLLKYLIYRFQEASGLSSF